MPTTPVGPSKSITLNTTSPVGIGTFPVNANQALISFNNTTETAGNPVVVWRNDGNAPYNTPGGGNFFPNMGYYQILSIQELQDFKMLAVGSATTAFVTFFNSTN